ncbi:BTB/POZ domain-containing protein DOT3 [Cannabis sativa]|uniref:BTB/POZ domain-containing protein DOT3 n=1 Tax=Cannabis sativa TaxID=3483 RepID=UPI0029C9C262|nr:BTB/POZ domain-containing protein DOT3 [Cannabis sativa]
MMKKTMTHPPSSGNDFDENDQVREQRIVLPSKFITNISDGLERKEPSWFITSQIPTDFSIQVEETTFNAHKYPLVAKCGYFSRVDIQQQPNSSFNCDIKLENFPGGSETFETILKFCYGFPIDFSSKNIAPLRCAAEYLDMTEELDDGNLVTKTEAFLTFVVLSSWKDTITVIKSCEDLSPWVENLQIVRRCCDSIAWKASRENTPANSSNTEGWWFDEIAILRIDHFMRIMTTIKAKGSSPEIIGKCIMHYARRWLTGMDEELEGIRGYGHGKSDLQFSILSRREEEGEEGIAHGKRQKMIIENLVSLLPPQHEAVSCKFLLQMLKIANVYSVTPALISELEKRVGMLLEDANANDLLIPRYKNADQTSLVNSSEDHTMYDTDLVRRIVEYFLMQEQQQLHLHLQRTENISVSKLLDNYLAEIARDPNLSITKFQVLAELLPENARACHDGLYRAIDIYLKTHPSLPEHDRRRLCKIMNCNKLSLDACTHAAQNDRLPLRTVVQVLFSEQVKMRTTIQEKDPSPSDNISEQEGNQPTTEMEIKTLKVELENIKRKMSELQSDYSELQQEYDKVGHKQIHAPRWSLGWRKIKTSFHTKMEGDGSGEEPEEGKQRPNSVRYKISSKRRSSIA